MKKYTSLATHHQTLRNISPGGQDSILRSLIGKRFSDNHRQIRLGCNKMENIQIHPLKYLPFICFFSFANTVTGQFYGHTHNDEFTIFYDYETNQIPINVAFVTPSVTTFTGLNPSFRFYTLDGPYEGASMVSKFYIYIEAEHFGLAPPFFNLIT